MLYRYYLSLTATFLFSLLFLVGYFFYSHSAAVADSTQVLTDTHYSSEEVEGAIQPIPLNVEYDIKWARLGKALFNSTLLSGDNTIACASCHLVDFGGDDGFPVSTGVNSKIGTRNSPTVLNAVFNFRQFWDGRSKDLADQASGPVHNPVEMNSNWPEVIAKLEQEVQFKKAFNEVGAEGITAENIIKAITVYEETLITPNAPIDQFLRGDKSALTQQQQRGFKKFVKFGCVTCHQGRNIGGNFYQKLGRIGTVPDILLDDTGLYQRTNNDSDKYSFKVPSLRNIADTAPYFHNGSVASLDQAVKVMAQSQLGLKLAQKDADDLVALLQSFSAKPLKVSQ